MLCSGEKFFCIEASVDGFWGVDEVLDPTSDGEETVVGRRRRGGVCCRRVMLLMGRGGGEGVELLIEKFEGGEDSFGVISDANDCISAGNEVSVGIITRG